MKASSLNSQLPLKKTNHSGNNSDDESRSNHKKKLLKKKRYLPYSQIKCIDLKHIVNVSDIWFIN